MTERPEEHPFAPRRNTHLVGHEAAEASLLEAWNSGRMHHAWLIGGPAGIGKATLAFRIARFALSQGLPGSGPGAGEPALFGAPEPPRTLAVDPESPAARRIAASGHADLLTVERTWDEKKGRYKRDVPVDEVRKIAPFLRKTAGEGGWRVVVLDGADQMNTEGQNAVLKILEEPPPNCLILLVADNIGGLLPTIRSRTRRLLLEPLSEQQVLGLLGRYLPDLEGAERTGLARLAEGSIGRAVDLHNAGGLDLYRKLLGLLEGLPRLEVEAMYKLSDLVSKPGDDTAWEAMTDLLSSWLARLIRSGARGTLPPEVVKGEQELSARLLRRSGTGGGLDRWVEVWENTTRLFARADSVNLDRRQVLVQVLLGIEKAAG